MEYLKALREGQTDPVTIINVEEFEEVEDLSAPFDARNLKVVVLDRPGALRWLEEVDRPVCGAERVENATAQSMTLFVISWQQVDVITRPSPVP
jgi:hypothetical protein